MREKNEDLPLTPDQELRELINHFFDKVRRSNNEIPNYFLFLDFAGHVNSLNFRIMKGDINEKVEFVFDDSTYLTIDGLLIKNHEEIKVKIDQWLGVINEIHIEAKSKQVSEY